MLIQSLNTSQNTALSIFSTHSYPIVEKTHDITTQAAMLFIERIMEAISPAKTTKP
jgi:hypothetical protein